MASIIVAEVRWWPKCRDPRRRKREGRGNSFHVVMCNSNGSKYRSNNLGMVAEPQLVGLMGVFGIRNTTYMPGLGAGLDLV